MCLLYKMINGHGFVSHTVTHWHKICGCGRTRSDIPNCKAVKRLDHPAHNELSSDIFCANRSTGSWRLQADTFCNFGLCYECASQTMVWKLERLRKKNNCGSTYSEGQNLFLGKYITDTNCFVSSKHANVFVCSTTVKLLCGNDWIISVQHSEVISLKGTGISKSIQYHKTHTHKQERISEHLYIQSTSKGMHIHMQRHSWTHTIKTTSKSIKKLKAIRPTEKHHQAKPPYHIMKNIQALTPS